MSTRIRNTIATTVASLAATSGANAYYSNTSFSVGDGYELTHSWDIDGTGSALGFFSCTVMGGDTNYLKLKLGTGDGIANFVSNGNTSLLKMAANASLAGASHFFTSDFALMRRITYQTDHAVRAGSVSSGFTSGTPGYVGFTFTYNSTQYYGWALIKLTEGPTYGTVTVTEWSCSSNMAFAVGQIDNTAFPTVPEPAESAAGLGLLALGAAGLRRWRKSKAA